MSETFRDINNIGGASSKPLSERANPGVPSGTKSNKTTGDSKGNKGFPSNQKKENSLNNK